MSQQPSSKPALKAVTPAHLIVSVLITALVTAGNAVWQYCQSGSNFSFTQLLGIGFSALLATLGVGVISLEKSPDIQQSIDGSLAPYVSALNQALQQHRNVIQQGVQVVNDLYALTQHQANQQAQKPVQQQQAPAQQQQPVRAPQSIPAINLATPEQVNFPTTTQSYNPVSQTFSRNFDTGLTPTINQ